MPQLQTNYLTLFDKWPNMTIDKKIGCIQAIYEKVKEMTDIKFLAYGSLYPTNTMLDSVSKQNLNKEFCIGPHCGARYWNCNVGESRYYHKTKPNQGPCEFSYPVRFCKSKLLMNS